jgi:hypothetical protein
MAHNTVVHAPAEEACSTAREAAELARLMALPAMLLGRRRRLPVTRVISMVESNNQGAQRCAEQLWSEDTVLWCSCALAAIFIAEQQVTHCGKGSCHGTLIRHRNGFPHLGASTAATPVEDRTNVWWFVACLSCSVQHNTAMDQPDA